MSIIIHKPSNISADIELGAVELKDAESDLRAEITSAGLAVFPTQDDFTQLQTEVFQAVPSGLNATVYQGTSHWEVAQSTASDLHTTAYQSDFNNLQVEAFQPTASGLQTTANQSTAANLKAQVFPGGRQYITPPITVAISGTTARSTQLSLGRYELFSTTDCYFLQGDTTVVALTSSYPLGGGFELPEPMVVTASGNSFVAAITGGATGTLFIEPVQEQ